jgi:hypothetical protein
MDEAHPTHAEDAETEAAWRWHSGRLRKYVEIGIGSQHSTAKRLAIKCCAAATSDAWMPMLLVL